MSQEKRVDVHYMLQRVFSPNETAISQAGNASSDTNQEIITRKYWYFNDNLKELRFYSIYNTLMGMKTTCRFFLERFINLKQENITFTIGFAYKIQDITDTNKILTGGFNSKQIFPDKELTNFEKEYIDVITAFTEKFYEELQVDAKYGKIAIFSLEYKTIIKDTTPEPPPEPLTRSWQLLATRGIKFQHEE